MIKFVLEALRFAVHVVVCIAGPSEKNIRFYEYIRSSIRSLKVIPMSWISVIPFELWKSAAAGWDLGIQDERALEEGLTPVTKRHVTHLRLHVWHICFL